MLWWCSQSSNDRWTPRDACSHWTHHWYDSSTKRNLQQICSKSSSTPTTSPSVECLSDQVHNHVFTCCWAEDDWRCLFTVYRCSFNSFGQLSSGVGLVINYNNHDQSRFQTVIILTIIMIFFSRLFDCLTSIMNNQSARFGWFLLIIFFKKKCFASCCIAVALL